MTTPAIQSALLGTNLQIRFDKGYTDLINNDVEDMIVIDAMKQEAGAVNRSFTFAVKSARKVSNAQMVAVGKNEQAFIDGEGIDISEKFAQPKEINVACQFEQAVFERAKKDPSLVYGDVMSMTIEDSVVSSKETIIREYVGDGTGALASVASAAVSGGKVVLTLNNTSDKIGSIYWLLESMKIRLADASGNEDLPTLSAGTCDYLVVDSIDFESLKISCSAITTTGSVGSASAVGDIDANSILYPESDKAANGGAMLDRTAITDYGYLLHMPGRQILANDSGLTVNGVTGSGVFAGTQKDAAGATLFYTMFNDLLQLGNRRNGRSAIDYKTLQCSFKTLNHITNLEQGNLVIQTLDNERGGKSWFYVRGNQRLELIEGRFCPDYEVWAEPVSKMQKVSPSETSGAPLQFLFTGFDYIRDPETGAAFRYKVKDGQRLKTVEAHLQGFGTFVARQPSAILRLHGFKINA